MASEIRQLGMLVSKWPLKENRKADRSVSATSRFLARSSGWLQRSGNSIIFAGLKRAPQGKLQSGSPCKSVPRSSQAVVEGAGSPFREAA